MAALKWLVGIMTVLLVAGTVGLVVLIVQRLGGAAEQVVLPPLALNQPAGTRVVTIAPLAEGRLAVLVARPDGERILFLDPRRGRVVGEVRPGE